MSMDEQRDATGMITHRKLPEKTRALVRVLLDAGFVREPDQEGRAEAIVVFQRGAEVVWLAQAGQDELSARVPWTWELWPDGVGGEPTSGQGAVALRKALR